VFRSDDGGDSWMRVNSDHRFRQRAWYYSHIFADPAALDTVYVLDTGAFRSTNGGQRISSCCRRRMVIIMRCGSTPPAIPGA